MSLHFSYISIQIVSLLYFFFSWAIMIFISSFTTNKINSKIWLKIFIFETIISVIFIKVKIFTYFYVPIILFESVFLLNLLFFIFWVSFLSFLILKFILLFETNFLFSLEISSILLFLSYSSSTLLLLWRSNISSFLSFILLLLNLWIPSECIFLNSISIVFSPFISLISSPPNEDFLFLAYIFVISLSVFIVDN